MILKPTKKDIQSSVWLLFFVMCGLYIPSIHAQDSLRVVISLDAANDDIERAVGFWEARANLDVKLDMYGFSGGKHLAHSFPMEYDLGEDAWVTKVPKGYYELNITSIGFSPIKFPMRLEKDHREEFTLRVDSSLLHCYENKKRYTYIQGALNFSSTLVVKFREGVPADHFNFLATALIGEGFEHLNISRIQKIQDATTYLVTLNIADRTPLNIVLYNKMTQQPETERGYLIGADVTQAIELIQSNSNVAYANPSFLNDASQTFNKSSNYPQSKQLERKLLKLMEEDPKTLDKINYIIESTTPQDTANDELE